MTEQDKRQNIVKIAKTWLRTPFVMNGRIKGSGVDCATLLVEVFEEAGLIPHVDAGNFKIDFHLHHSKEYYLEWVTKYCTEIELSQVQPGDLLLFKFGRIVSHSALVIDFPILIQANIDGTAYANFNEETLKLRFNSIWSFDYNKNFFDK